MSDRAFVNKLGDHAGETWLLENGEVEASLKQRLASEVDRHVSTVVKAHEEGLVKADNHSVYTGSAGVTLLLLHLFKKTGVQQHLQNAMRLLEPALRSLTGKVRDCTFLCGDTGPLCIAAVAYHYQGPMAFEKRDDCISRVVKFHRAVASLARTEHPLPDEMLYGRAGYLYALLFLEHHIGQGCIPDDVIEKVAAAILDSGKQMGTSTCPLMYAWHDKHYLGAAHGMAGIYYQLLRVAARFPHLDIERTVRPCVDYLLKLRLPSGNCPSSLESSSRDELVHWCHGAPGWIYMLCAAYKTFKETKYLSAAVECANVVWDRGLLRKGYGLCHGAPGNAYSFLAMYQLTGEIPYLHRACKFAEWCFDCGKHGCRVADRPYSLFEGLAGTAYFLLDLQTPGEARFPAFEL